jgi:predicted nucleotidyltransferase
MVILTNLEQEVLLKFIKEPFEDYNSNNLAMSVGKSRVGVSKALSNLEKNTLVVGKTLGKARFFQINYDDEYARKTMEFLLMDESKNYQKWKDEFKELENHVKILVLFGSILRNENEAKDIDILIVYNEKNNNEISKIIKEKNTILTKKIHPIKQTYEDIKNNILKKDRIILSAIKDGIVLKGQDEFARLMQNVTSKK